MGLDTACWVLQTRLWKEAGKFCAHAVVPAYLFLTGEDQSFVIHKIHSEKKTSVVMTDEIKEALARNRAVRWYSVRCANFGMLHSYSTIIGTEKSMWVAFSGYEEGEI